MSIATKFAMAFVLVLGMSAVAKADDLVGSLTPKPASAGADVAAVLHVKKKGEAEEKKYNLIAGGEQAKQLADFLKSHSRVKVSGEVSGETLKVASVSAVEMKKKKDK
jgi:hypothetical protein